MKDRFHIIGQEIVQETGILKLKADGTAAGPAANHRLRIIAVFQAGEAVRRFPMEAACTDGEQGGRFLVQEEISLRDIFCSFSREAEGQPVTVCFEYCDAGGMWKSFPEKLELSGTLFVRGEEKEPVWKRFFRKGAYVLFTLLLPVWIIDGWLSVKGYKKSPYIDGEVRGKRAIFYHAQGIVRKFTGYGYSLREVKTNYFAKVYRKACRRTVNPEGILFLSERETDKGGNLDLIRNGVQSADIAWDEFIDERPVHKLPFAALRRAARLAAGARVIVLEDFYPQIHALELRRETRLLQLWHACGAFKMFGLSDIGKVRNLGQDTRNHRNYSYAFVSGPKMVPFYSEAFGIAPRQVLPLGVPRTDIFFDGDYRKKVREEFYHRYPMLRDGRVILFAPTFRGSGKKEAYYPAERFSVDRLLGSLPEDTVLVIKNHPFVKMHFNWSAMYRDRVLDLSGRENINDILFVTDLLITDYSSCIFEAALLEIPMLFYVFDLEEYVRGRDLYFDFASFAPGSQVDSFDGLVAEASRLVAEGGDLQEERLQEFCEYFLGSLDGHSTERILEFVLRNCK